MESKHIAKQIINRFHGTIVTESRLLNYLIKKLDSFGKQQYKLGYEKGKRETVNSVNKWVNLNCD